MEKEPKKRKDSIIPGYDSIEKAIEKAKKEISSIGKGIASIGEGMSSFLNFGFDPDPIELSYPETDDRLSSQPKFILELKNISKTDKDKLVTLYMKYHIPKTDLYDLFEIAKLYNKNAKTLEEIGNNKRVFIISEKISNTFCLKVAEHLINGNGTDRDVFTLSSIVLFYRETSIFD